MTAGGTDFVAAAVDRARDAARAAVTQTIDLAPGGVGVRVHLIGERVIDELGPALLVTDHPIDPVVELWSFDHGGSGLTPPPAPWSRADFRLREEIAGWTEPPLLASFDTAHATMSVANAEAGLGVQWARDAAAMAPWEGGAPLRYLLRWLLAPHGLHLVHGAVIGDEHGGVLLVGRGGAGKSTAALACADAGMSLVADDYFLLGTGPEPVAHPLFSIAKADDAAVALLGPVAARAPWAPRDWRGKYRLPVGDLITGSMTIRAIVCPRRADRTGVPVAGGARAAAKEVVTSSLSQLPGASATTLAALRPLFDRLPCYELAVGPDVERIPVVLTALLGELAAERL